LKRYDLRKRINDTSKFEVNVKRDRYTIQDKIGVIKKSLFNKSKMLFIDLFDEDTNKEELITTFLALLEIIKLKVATVAQEEPFSDIYIQRV
jgi:segregation and condensation protein A